MESKIQETPKEQETAVPEQVAEQEQDVLDPEAKGEEVELVLKPKKPPKRPVTMADQQKIAKMQRQQKKRNAAIRKEFQSWKAELRELINTKSQVVNLPDGSYKFLLPPELVRIVWNSTIREHVQAQIQEHGEEGAKERALANLRQQITEASDAILAGQALKEEGAVEKEIAKLEADGLVEPEQPPPPQEDQGSILGNLSEELGNIMGR